MVNCLLCKVIHEGQTCKDYKKSKTSNRQKELEKIGAKKIKVIFLKGLLRGVQKIMDCSSIMASV